MWYISLSRARSLCRQISWFLSLIDLRVGRVCSPRFCLFLSLADFPSNRQARETWTISFARALSILLLSLSLPIILFSLPLNFPFLSLSPILRFSFSLSLVEFPCRPWDPWENQQQLRSNISLAFLLPPLTLSNFLIHFCLHLPYKKYKEIRRVYPSFLIRYLQPPFLIGTPSLCTFRYTL